MRKKDLKVDIYYDIIWLTMIERIFKNEEEKERLESFLRKENFSSKQINNFLGDYTQQDSPFFFEYLNEESAINLSAINTILEAEKEKRSPSQTREMDEFKGFLKSKNLTVDEGLAIYRYSFYGSEILKLKRSGKSSAEEIQNMSTELEKSFSLFGEKKSLKNGKIIRDMIEFAKTLNPFEEYDIIQQEVNSYVNKLGFTQTLSAYCLSYIYDVMNVLRIGKNISNLDKSLKNQIPYNMVLYRAIDPSFLDLSKDVIKNPEILLGETLNQNGYTSTSLRYDNCFAKYSQYPLVLKIFVPKGTQGLDISRLSYLPNEEEVLLNSCNLFIFNISSFVHDKNSKYYGKIYADAVAISKDKACYKDVWTNNNNIVEVADENA